LTQRINTTHLSREQRYGVTVFVLRSIGLINIITNTNANQYCGFARRQHSEIKHTLLEEMLCKQKRTTNKQQQTTTKKQKKTTTHLISRVSN
jgi:hypothetical protein